MQAWLAPASRRPPRKQALLAYADEWVLKGDLRREPPEMPPCFLGGSDSVQPGALPGAWGEKRSWDKGMAEVTEWPGVSAFRAVTEGSPGHSILLINGLGNWGCSWDVLQSRAMKGSQTSKEQSCSLPVTWSQSGLLLLGQDGAARWNGVSLSASVPGAYQGHTEKDGSPNVIQLPQEAGRTDVASRGGHTQLLTMMWTPVTPSSRINNSCQGWSW